MTKKKAKRAGHRKDSKQAYHARFVKAYIAAGENGTQAVLAVKPALTPGSAAVESTRLLKLANVQKAIQQEREALRAKFALTTDRVVQELARVAYFNPRRMAGADGKVKQLHELDDDTAAALQLEVDGKGNVLKVRTPPPGAKNTAVEKAVKILRLYDKPPPPPPVDPATEGEVDQRDVARRMAFLLAREAHTSSRESKPAPKPVKKKVSLPV